MQAHARAGAARVCFNVHVGLLHIMSVLSWRFHYDEMWQCPLYEGHYSLFGVNTFANDCYGVAPFSPPSLRIPDVTQLAARHVIGGPARSFRQPHRRGCRDSCKMRTFQFAEM